ncbi:MAG: protein kinase [Planctomycetota bacterium]
MSAPSDDSTRDEVDPYEVTSDHDDNRPESSGDFVVEEVPETIDSRASLDPNQPRTIGRYRLLEPIGEGGMGVVWHAVQQHPVKRSVALKLVRAEAGSKSIFARFEAERQAIAMMDHPNIAKIFDADTTEQGNPYFVMELVKGVTLDKYCNRNRLTIRERLELFIPVCRAVQHAHQKGIIHRDLKHSNVLVAENDDRPVPKVIDFGLAKAQSHQNTLTDKTLYTELGRVVGTVQYMSPEQADSSGTDVDTRSDIYSLGVILYKLLSGVTPLQLEGEISILDALKTIREKDPKPPSEFIRNSMQAAQITAERRGTTAERLTTTLRGDLDSIVLKSLEKDRRDRYETANGLAMDVQRFLDDEPVIARPVSSIYQIKKFIRRNRGLVTSLGIITLLLVSGIVATSSAMMYAFSQRDIANHQTELAKTEAKNAEASEARVVKAKRLQAKQLHSQLMKSAWSNWQLGNVQSAWQTLRQIEPTNRDWLTRHLATEMDAAESILFGSARNVISLDISHDGKYFLSGGMGDSVILWDAKTGTQLRRMLVNEAVTVVRFSPDLDTVAVGDRSNVVSIFDVRTGELQSTLGPFEQDVASLAFHPEEPILAVGLFGKNLYREFAIRMRDESTAADPDLLIFDLETKEQIQTIEGHTDEIAALCFSPDGSVLYSACIDGNVRAFRRSSETGDDWSMSLEFAAHRQGVQDIVVSPDNSKVASCGYDKTGKLWDAASGELITDLVGHQGPVLGVAFSPDGTRVATSSEDRSSIVWDLTGQTILHCRGHFQPVNDVRFTVDGNRIVTVADDQTVRIWNANRPLSSVRVTAHAREVWCADQSPDGTLVASGGEAGLVSLIDTENGTVTDQLKHEAAVLCLKFAPGGELVTSGADHQIHIWDTDQRKVIHEFEAHDDFVWDVSFSPDGKWLVSASSDGTAKVWSTVDWSLEATLEGHEAGLASARFSPDGAYLLTASDDCSIRLWDASSYKHLHTFVGHKNPVWRAVFSPVDSNVFASSGYDGKLILWDLAKRQPRPVSIKGHTSQVAGLTFTPDGKRLVSAGDDGLVKFWDVETGIELFVFHDELSLPVIHVSYSSDAKRMLTAGIKDVTIRTATANFETPFLKQDAVETTIKSERLVTDSTATNETLLDAQIALQRCCRHYPTFASCTYLGITQYRLGQVDEAIETLEEARRLQQIEYDQPDRRPYIEGYLALANHAVGRESTALEMLTLFDQLNAEFDSDAEAVALQQAVDEKLSGLRLAQ